MVVTISLRISTPTFLTSSSLPLMGSSLMRISGESLAWLSFVVLLRV